MSQQDLAQVLGSLSPDAKLELAQALQEQAAEQRKAQQPAQQPKASAKRSTKKATKKAASKKSGGVFAKAAQGRKRATVKHSAASVEPAQSPAQGQSQGRQRRQAKYSYGQADTVKGDAAATIEARDAQLDAGIPGLRDIANVVHQGRDATSGKLSPAINGAKSRAIRNWATTPWTWIELPSPKGKQRQAFEAYLGMTLESVKKNLAAMGYGWSPANAAWGTDSSGNPAHRKPWHKTKKAGRKALEAAAQGEAENE